MGFWNAPHPSTTSWDERTATPLYGTMPRGQYALDYQGYAEMLAQRRRQGLWSDAQRAQQQAGQLFEQYRPSGAVMLRSRLYQDQAGLYAAQANAFEAPDLLAGYREDQRLAAERRARKARKRAQIGQIVATVGAVAATAVTAGAAAPFAGAMIAAGSQLAGGAIAGDQGGYDAGDAMQGQYALANTMSQSGQPNPSRGQQTPGSIAQPGTIPRQGAAQSIVGGQPYGPQPAPGVPGQGQRIGAGEYGPQLEGQGDNATVQGAQPQQAPQAPQQAQQPAQRQPGPQPQPGASPQPGQPGGAQAGFQGSPLRAGESIQSPGGGGTMMDPFAMGDAFAGMDPLVVPAVTHLYALMLEEDDSTDILEQALRERQMVLR